MRAHEQLDRARDKAQRIIDMVTSHSLTVLRDAEDRTRQLRWQQQQQMTSFMAEVSDLIRPESAFDAADAEPAEEREESSSHGSAEESESELEAVEG
jgi:hypothetical protein